MTTMPFTAAEVMELRARSGAPMMQCKRALTDADGDNTKALTLLREQGCDPVNENREASEGFVGSYIHQGGKIGVLVELACETDFVARTSEFQNLAREIAMHIAFADPQYLSAEQIPEDVLEVERMIARNLARNEGKSVEMLDRIADGRVRKFQEVNCLLTQPYCREPGKRVGELVQELRSRMRENIQIKRFVRFKIGSETHS